MGHTYAGPGATIGPAPVFRLPRRGGHRPCPLIPTSPSARSSPTARSRGRKRTCSSTHWPSAPPIFGTPPETHGLRALPSFGIVAPSFHETAPPPLDLPGCELDLAQVVHGAQSISVTGPIPTSGTATLSTRISDVWDKGKAAVIWQEGVARSASGEELWTVRSSIFARGEGGFGGSRGSSTTVAVPDRVPDASSTYDVTAQQALLYRLCGDRNPLHVDPEFAASAGFPAPILHGLCTYRIVLREVTELLLDGDSSRTASFGGTLRGRGVPRRDDPRRRPAGRRSNRRRRDRGCRPAARSRGLPGHHPIGQLSSRPG
ncbi:MaoC/PaaZ C-terminal domain-containing protein [Nocardioides sp. B-3]|uniref:MaoC/PaaZ C-terminal domain-containing protein n=1 Tax=Nocardioides sp. B-3 TaxID=2895565 RepID=UPI0021527DFD|nr:MaoC/PaaZ C-terminal domain-containing protein [Nocardioides sp. B-3]UUZ59289.1 hypothetical protein LP418_26090 [Nocardioides sp. B-3]